MNKTLAITTMLISRDQITRLGVKNVLAGRRHIRLIELPADTKQMDALIMHEQPRVILIDTETEVDVPGLVHRMKTLVPTVKIVLLAGFGEPPCDWKTFSSRVDGVILKVQPPEALVAHIENLCEIAAPHEPAKPCETSDQDGLKESLTEREREIIALIGRGLSNKDIADRLCISVITVRHHLTSIFDKLGVATRQKLLIRAHQYGLVDFSVPPLT